MSDYEAKWYVVHTYSGYENKVAGDLMTTAENRNLQDMIIDVKVPTEIVTETRLQKAKQLLEDPSLRTLDVGSMVGYHDTSYFIQSFRKRFGVTPNEYRGLMAL